MAVILFQIQCVSYQLALDWQYGGDYTDLIFLYYGQFDKIELVVVHW